MEQILELDRQICETLTVIELLRSGDYEVTESEMAVAFRRNLVNLLIQLEPQLKRPREHVGDYWNGPLDLGTLDLPDGVEVTNLSEGQSLTLQGLRDIVELPNPITYLYQTSVKALGVPSRSVSSKREYTIPIEILQRAYRYTVEWGSKVGLGLSLQTDEDAWEGWT